MSGIPHEDAKLLKQFMGISPRDKIVPEAIESYEDQVGVWRNVAGTEDATPLEVLFVISRDMAKLQKKHSKVKETAGA